MPEHATTPHASRRRQAPSGSATAPLAPASRDTRGASRVDSGGVVTAALHDLLGNETARGAGADAGLADHAFGLSMLGGAGFSNLPSPGGAPASAMREILRDVGSQAEREGLDTARAAAHIGARTGERLPEAVRARLEAAFGRDFGHVRIHTDGAAADAAQALNALAFTIGRDIYFGRGAFQPASTDGLELIAHELTHVVQADEGRLPGPKGPGLDVSSPSDPHEREAYAMGAKVAREAGAASAPANLETTPAPAASPVGAALSEGVTGGGGAFPAAEESSGVDAGVSPASVGTDGPVASAAPVSRAAVSAGARERGASGRGTRAPTTGAAHTPSGAQTPATTKQKLLLAGKLVEVDAPESGKKETTTTRFKPLDIPGVTLRTATLAHKEDGTVTSGRLTMDLQLGEVIHAKGVVADIDSKGRVVESVTGVTAQIPGIGEIKVTVTIGAQGLRARGLADAAQVRLPGGLVPARGGIEVEIDEKGRTTGNGTLGGTWEGFGDWRLVARMQPDGTFGGEMDLTVSARTLAQGVALEGGVLRGTVNPQGGSLRGELPVTVSEVLRGTFAAELRVGDTALAGRGRVAQAKSWQVGALTLEQASFEVRADTSGAVELRGSATLTHELVEGTIRGTWDPVAGKLSGEGPAGIRKPLPVGTLAQVTELAGVARVQDNELVELRGQLRAEVNYEGQPTLRLQADDGCYAVKTQAVSGEGAITILRDVTFGKAPGVHAVLPQGGVGRATLVDNHLAAMSAGVGCVVRDSRGDLANGELRFTLDAAQNATGEGVATLAVDYGFPSRDDETCVVKKGSAAAIVVENSVPTRLELRDAAFSVKNPVATGRVEGTFAGAIDLTSGAVLGDGRATLVEDWPLVVGFGSLTATQGGELEVRSDKDGISEFHGRVPATAEFAGAQPVTVHGELTGHWTRADGKATGSLSGVLGNDVVVGVGEDRITVKEGVTVGGEVKEGALQYLHLHGQVVYTRQGEDLLTGTLDEARYDVGTSSVDATASLALARDVSTASADGRFTTTLEKDSQVRATIAANELTQLGGQFGVRVADAKGPLAGGTITDATVDPRTWLASGRAVVTTDRELPVPPQTEGAIPGTELKAAALPGSGLAGDLVDNALAGVQAMLLVRVDDPKGPLAEGTLEGALNLADGSHSVSGEVALAREVPLTPQVKGSDPNRPDAWMATLIPGSKVGATLDNGQFARAGLNAQARIDRGAQAIATAQLEGQWRLGDDAEGFDGTARVDLAQRLPWFAGGRFATDVDKGTSVVATLAKSSITSTRGTMVLTSQLDGQDTLRTTTSAEAEWTPGAGVTASGEARLLRELKVSDRGILSGDTTWLEPESAAKAEFENDDLKRVGGTLTASVRDQGGEYVRAEGAGEWTWESGDRLEVRGTAGVTRDKAVPSKGAYAPTLLGGKTEAQANIVEGALTELTGTIGVRVDKGGAPFANIDAEGRWGPETGLDGAGRAELLVEELRIAEVSKFSLYLTKGANATAKVAADEVTEIGGQVPLSIREQGAPFLRGELGGAYDIPGENFSGKGSVEVVNDRKLADAGAEQLWLEKGTGASVDIQQNAIQDIGGNVNLGMRDAQGRYLGVRFEEGKYDLVGGTGFTGKGSATVVRRKRLTTLGDYTFDLDKGAGARAVVEQDHLTDVSGLVPFVVGDAAGDLLKGQVDGHWTAEQGKIDGKGKVSLARDLTWGSVKLMKGSGGEGEVVESKLQRFKGMMTARIAGQDGKDFVELKAEGEFDAVNGRIVELVGAARTLQPMQVMAGVKVTEMKGTATVRENALESLDGSLSVLVKPDGSRMTATGTLQGGWRKQGERDLFHGAGTLNLNLGKSPQERGITNAKLAGSLAEDGSFGLEGQADYRLNKFISGKLGFSLQHKDGQPFDPVLSGSLNAKGNLIEGKELFRRGQTLYAQPIPVAAPFGGINIGARAEVSLKTKPVALAGNFGIRDWHPVTAATDAPDFDANLDITWGMLFEAALIPYLEVHAGLTGIVEAGMGIEGRASLDVDPELKVGLGLHGEKGKYWGELAAGVSIAPQLNVSVTPYLYASLLSRFKGKYAFSRYQLASLTLFQWNWSDSFVFGDAPRSGGGKVPTTKKVPAKADRTSEKVENQKPAGKDGDSTGVARTEGGPSVDGKDMLGGLGGKAGDPLGALRSKLEPVITVFEGLGAIKDLAVLVFDIAQALTSPIGIIKFIWKIVTGAISFAKIKSAVDKLVKFIDQLAKWLEGVVPDWIRGVMNFVRNGPPNILDALFGRDEAVGALVRDPVYLQKLDAQTSREFIGEVASGWVADGDERSIMLILENANRKGFIRSVVTDSGYANWILGKVDGREDARARFLFKQNGIQFDGIHRPTDYMHATAAIT
jgi:hypothetical protein